MQLVMFPRFQGTSSGWWSSHGTTNIIYTAWVRVAFQYEKLDESILQALWKTQYFRQTLLSVHMNNQIVTTPRTRYCQNSCSRPVQFLSIAPLDHMLSRVQYFRRSMLQVLYSINTEYLEYRTLLFLRNFDIGTTNFPWLVMRISRPAPVLHENTAVNTWHNQRHDTFVRATKLRVLYIEQTSGPCTI